ncbi:hypothetical protein MKX01_016055, partial [Papaver californicum]
MHEPKTPFEVSKVKIEERTGQGVLNFLFKFYPWNLKRVLIAVRQNRMMILY